MQTRYPDHLRPPFKRMTRLIAFRGHDLELAVGREGLIVLRDLISLRQIGIEVVLAREDRLLVDVQTKRECSARAEFDDAPVQHGQCARQTETDRTSIRVR